jgi:hypothetical protein
MKFQNQVIITVISMLWLVMLSIVTEDLIKLVTSSLTQELQQEHKDMLKYYLRIMLVGVHTLISGQTVMKVILIIQILSF